MKDCLALMEIVRSFEVGEITRKQSSMYMNIWQSYNLYSLEPSRADTFFRVIGTVCGYVCVCVCWPATRLLLSDNVRSRARGQVIIHFKGYIDPLCKSFSILQV